MSAPMDISSDDDDIAAIVSLNNQFFYTHIFEESDTKSDDDADLMVVVASVLHDENEAYMPQWRGSMLGELPIWTATGRTATCSFTPTTSTRKRRCIETSFGAVFRCQGSYLGELLKVFHLHDPYFRCKPDATGKLGFSSYQKCSTAIRMLAYGVA
jgi:hypothetical protein